MGRALGLTGLGPGKGAQLVALALWMVLGLGPLLALLAGLAEDSGFLRQALPDTRRMGLLANSVVMALGVGLFTTLVAVLAVTWMQGLSGRWNLLQWLPLTMIAVPPFVHAGAWMEAGDLLQTAMRDAGLIPLSVPDGFAVIWVQGMAFLPIAYGFALAALSGFDPALLDAGRMSAGPARVMAFIRLPLAFPIIAIGSGFVVLLSLMDFSIPMLFQIRGYAMELFVTYSAGAHEGTVLLLALPMMALSLGLVMVLLGRIRHYAANPQMRRRTAAIREQVPPWLLSLQRLALGLVIVQTLAPLALLVAATESFQAFGAVVLAARSEIRSSLVAALASAFLSAAIGLVLYRRLESAGWLLLCLLPLAVPATLIGIGLIKMWNHAMTAALYGSALMPVLASVARFSPIMVLILHYFDRAVARDLVDAARILRGDSLACWLQVLLPLIMPGVVAGFVMVFALSLGELPATLLVVPPGESTLSVRIFNLLHYGGSQGVASLCLFVMLMTMMAGVLFLLSLNRRGSAGTENGSVR